MNIAEDLIVSELEFSSPYICSHHNYLKLFVELYSVHTWSSSGFDQ